MKESFLLLIKKAGVHTTRAVPRDRFQIGGITASTRGTSAMIRIVSPKFEAAVMQPIGDFLADLWLNGLQLKPDVYVLSQDKRKDVEKKAAEVMAKYQRAADGSFASRHLQDLSSEYRKYQDIWYKEMEREIKRLRALAKKDAGKKAALLQRAQAEEVKLTLIKELELTAGQAIGQAGIGVDFTAFTKVENPGLREQVEKQREQSLAEKLLLEGCAEIRNGIKDLDSRASADAEKTLGPIKRFQRKLKAVQYLTPVAGAIDSLIAETLARLPKTGRIEGVELLALQALVRIMLDPASLAGYGKALLAKEVSAKEALDANLKGQAAEAEVVVAPVEEGEGEMEIQAHDAWI